MAVTRSSRRLAEKAADVVELSSDSEPEAPEVIEPQEVEVEKESELLRNSPDVDEQPLLKAAGIRYKTETTETPSGSKLAVRTRDTGSVKHRHVSIEIPLPTASELRHKKGDSEVVDSQDGNDEEVFKTPMERRHITFDDSDHDEFVTPKEGPTSNPLEGSIARPSNAKAEASKDEEEEEEEDSDDDAPPEAVSTRDAEAQTLKAAEAIEKAAKQQATALKRKRQERDAFLKQQADERKRTQKPASLEKSAESTPVQAEEETREVPKLLPLELLESDDEDDVPYQPTHAPKEQNKRRKLSGAEKLLVEPKLPKDKRLGSTAYRVVKGNGNGRLAPQARKQAVNLKEALLRRDRVAQPRGGFFANRR